MRLRALLWAFMMLCWKAPLFYGLYIDYVREVLLVTFTVFWRIIHVSSVTLAPGGRPPACSVVVRGGRLPLPYKAKAALLAALPWRSLRRRR